jgi:tape measure domain-containing protein
MSDYNIRAIITAVDRGFSSTLGSAQANLSKFSRNAANSTQTASDKVNTLSSSFKSMASAIGVMQLVNKAVTVIGNSVGAAVKRVDTLANANRVFQNMGFSAKETSSMMDDLKASINGLPTALDDAVSGVQMLAASTGDLGKSQKVYSALNDSIIGFGGSTADVKNAVLQLSQAFANGKIDGMTWISMMNSQMGPVLTAMAKKFGMTTGELKDALSEGKISVGEFQDALIELDQKGGGGLTSLHQIAMDATSGIGTSVENAKTAVTRGVAGIINAINSGLKAANLPTISQMISSLGNVAENVMNRIASVIPGVISAFARFTGGLQPLQPLIKGIVIALTGLVAAIMASTQINSTITLFKNLGTAIGALSNPTTIVVAAIALIVAAFIKAYKSSATFRDGINQVMQAVSSVDFSGLMSAIQNLISTLSGALKPAIDGIKNATSSIDWSSVAATARNAFQVIIDVITQVINFISKIVQAIGEVIQGFNSVGGTAAVFSTIRNVIQAVFTVLSSIVGIVGSVLQGFISFGVATGLFNAIGQALGVIAKLLKGLSPVIGTVLGAWMAWKGATTIIGGVSKAVNGVSAAVGGIGTAISSASQIVGSIGPAFSTAFGVVTNVINVAKTAWSTFSTLLMANPFTIVIIAAAAAAAALTWFFTQTETGRRMWQSFKDFLFDLWNSISETTQDVWNSITTFLSNTWQNIVTTAQSIWQGIVAFFTNLWNGILTTTQTVWNGITTTIQTAIQVVSNVISTVMSTIQGIWSSIWNAISNVVSTVWNVIQSTVSSAINAVSSVISSVMNAIKNTVSSIWNGVKSVTSSVWNGIKSVVSTAVNAVKSVVTSVMNAIRSVISSVWNSIRNIISNAVNSVRSVVSSGFNAVRSAVSNGMNAAVSAVRSAASGMVSAGQAMIRGLVNGIRSGMSWVVSAARNVARAAVNAAKAALHIGSPSKIMRDQVGKWIPAGVGVGIDRNLGWITKATDGMRDAAMFDVPSPDMSPLANGLKQVQAMTSQAIETSLNSEIDHELTMTSQPAYINLNLGGSDYTAYVADISREQGSQVNLSRYRI